MDEDFANQDADLTSQVLKLGGNPFGASGDLMTPNGLAAQVRRLRGANKAPQQADFPALRMFHGQLPPSFPELLDHAAQAYRQMLNGGMVNLGGLTGWNPAYAYQNFMPWMYGVAQPAQVMGMNQMGGSAAGASHGNEPVMPQAQAFGNGPDAVPDPNDAPQQADFPALLDHAAQAYRQMLNGGMVNLGGLMGWNPAYAYQNFMPWMYGVAQPAQVMGMNQMGGE